MALISYWIDQSGSSCIEMEDLDEQCGVRRRFRALDVPEALIADWILSAYQGSVLLMLSVMNRRSIDDPSSFF